MKIHSHLAMTSRSRLQPTTGLRPADRLDNGDGHSWLTRIDHLDAVDVAFDRSRVVAQRESIVGSPFQHISDDELGRQP
jgi:hypothetical protein